MPETVTDYGAFFEQNGYLPGVTVLEGEDLAALRRNFDDLESKIGKENAQYSLHNAHMQHEFAMQAAAHPTVVRVLTDILGPNVFLLDSRFICKYPVSQVSGGKPDVEPYVAWHQDVRYWGVDGGPVVSVWLAIDDADAENGAVYFIPGSHKDGLQEHGSAQKEGNMLTSNQEIPAELVDESKKVLCPLKAGQMSLHHGLTVHASEPNRSSRRRCGFVLRYVPTCAYPSDDPDRPRTFPATVLVSGENQEGYFADKAPGFFKKTA
ncbi:L-threonyl-[L-threonyl-carrier protein] 4-chlorinase-like [Branchiostoma floridae x Branchiostoma belcheri]